jgi:hypothetical protein
MLEKADLVSYLTNIVTWQNSFLLPLEEGRAKMGVANHFYYCILSHLPNPLPSRRGNFWGQEILKIFPKCDLRRTL